MSIKIILADDHKVFRLGIRSIVEEIPNTEVIGEASDGGQLLKLLETHIPHLVLMDLNMPKMNGMEALREIKKRNTKFKKSTRVIIISVHDSESYIVEAIEEGACGYLSKLADPDEIKMAIESVYSNGIYFNEKTNKAVLNRLVKRKMLRPVFDDCELSLSDNEFKVLKMICLEMTSDEIAKHVYLSKRTIEDIRYQLLRKTKTSNSVGLALWAAKNGLIELH